MMSVYGVQNREIYKNGEITVNRTMAFHNAMTDIEMER
jgi:hypothetical protein